MAAQASLDLRGRPFRTMGELPALDAWDARGVAALFTHSADALPPPPGFSSESEEDSALWSGLGTAGCWFWGVFVVTCILLSCASIILASCSDCVSCACVHVFVPPLPLLLKRPKTASGQTFSWSCQGPFWPMSVQSWRDERGLQADADFAFYFLDFAEAVGEGGLEVARSWLAC